jgi:tetratricopeptide (TPR) repeat protein
MRSNWIFAVGIGLAMSCLPAIASDRSDRIACTQADRPDAKLAACTRLLETGKLTNQDRSKVYYARGIAWAEGNDEPSRAIADYNEALRLNPNYFDVYNSRGIAWLRMGEFDHALSDFNQSILLAPQTAENAILYNNRGNVWLEQKREFERAIVDYNNAIRLDPKNSNAYNGRGTAWKELGQLDRAIADYTDAIRFSPKFEKAYANRGESWRLKGDLDRALADQDRAVALNSKASIAYVLRGDTRRYKGDFADAIADYQRALENSPGLVTALTGLGLTFEKMGDLTNARVKFEQACSYENADQRFTIPTPSAFETCRARLAAINSGVAQPTIPISLPKATSTTSIPTPSVPIPVVSPTTAVAIRGRRVALVIGNSTYKSVPTLANPLHDADAIVGTLKAIGFATVTLIEDGTREALVEALRKFAEEAEKADWAMIYYAGHGMEMNGVNYLIPVDAKLAADRDLQFEAVPLDQLLISVEGARKLKLILLDACRDNPFAPTMRRTATPEIVATGRSPGATMGTRSIGRGLGEVKVSGATLVVFAAKNGQTALDGEGRNSPFAIAVTQRIATPEVEITKVFRLVRDDVMEATAGRQEPYTYGSLPGNEDFFFVAK